MSNNIQLYVISHSEEDIRNIRSDDVYALFLLEETEKIGFYSNRYCEDKISKKHDYMVNHDETESSNKLFV